MFWCLMPHISANPGPILPLTIDGVHGEIQALVTGSDFKANKVGDVFKKVQALINQGGLSSLDLEKIGKGMDSIKNRCNLKHNEGVLKLKWVVFSILFPKKTEKRQEVWSQLGSVAQSLQEGAGRIEAQVKLTESMNIKEEQDAMSKVLAEMLSDLNESPSPFTLKELEVLTTEMTALIKEYSGKKNGWEAVTEEMGTVIKAIESLKTEGVKPPVVASPMEILEKGLDVFFKGVPEKGGEQAALKEVMNTLCQKAPGNIDIKQEVDGTYEIKFQKSFEVVIPEGVIGSMSGELVVPEKMKITLSKDGGNRALQFSPPIGLKAQVKVGWINVPVVNSIPSIVIKYDETKEKEDKKIRCVLEFKDIMIGGIKEKDSSMTNFRKITGSL